MSSSKINIPDIKYFSDHVFGREELTIVEFQDEENASCQIMIPVFDNLKEFFAERIVCYMVPKSTASEIWEQYKIFQSPSYLLIKENRTVERITGLISYDNFVSVVKKYI